MATDIRRHAAVAALAAILAALLPQPGAAAPSPWWEPAGFAGTEVSRVTSGGGVVTVVAGGRAMRSDDGVHFTPAAAPPPPPVASIQAGDRTWAIRSGTVVTGAGDALAPDPGAPDLGPGAQLIAAPASLPGVVIAVAGDGVVWRRQAPGVWDRSLLLLPATLVTGVPAVTAVAAFAQPVSGAVYVATRGYGTLLTPDGGADWLRADAGLPPDVLDLATDGSSTPPVIYAGTTEGLFVHRLRPLPAIPSYTDRDLAARWALTILVCLLATAAAAFGLLRLTPPSRLS